ncbi:methyl-accepting chemotaxis protein [Desulfonatronum thioautotrophicum]|uniref:methyl-accepting chemotaxis protein n=1 Tax=Desulfonatronum thioautotrophicum TaxID=617001 RepID=UPI000B0B02F9|nr:methyl-accepting chemotaxis protein [Desulfonatronum thioautotrophicum]
MSDTEAHGFEPERFMEHARDWAVRLESLSQNLARVIPGREEEFLALGSTIQAFSTKAREMSKEAGALTELTAGEEVAQIVETLGGELDQISQTCGLSCREADVGRLEKIVTLVSSLEQRTGSFRKIVRSLQMLGVTTRIESARLGDKGKGFMNLAGQVDSLGQNIIEHWKKIEAEITVLCEQVTNALARTRNLVQEQQAVTEKAVSSGRANLATLIRLSEHSAETSRTVSHRTKDVSKHVGSIVASLQFHDIARQQVEHVCEAVEDMTQMLDPSTLAGEGEQAFVRMQETACWVADVCSLQVSQLRYCGNAFEQAITTLITDLSSIADAVDGLNRDLREVLSAEEDSSDNILDQIQMSVHQLIDFMRGFSAKGEQLATIMVTVGETVAQMATFVGNIEDVGAEIELIALNASVQAAHTGDEGLALGVLAGAIQRLSVEARTLTDVVADELREISGHAQELQKLSDVSEDARRMEQQVRRLEEMITSLRNLDQQTVALLAEVQTSGDELCRDLRDQIAGITFHHQIVQELSTFGAALADVADQAMLQSSAECDPARRPERLKELLSRYTMEAERMVHLGTDSASGDGAGADDVELFGSDDAVELFGDDPEIELFDDPESPGGKQGKEDFGDNVELF